MLGPDPTFLAEEQLSSGLVSAETIHFDTITLMGVNWNAVTVNDFVLA
jgi:hypothetical protein